MSQVSQVSVPFDESCIPPRFRRVRAQVPQFQGYVPRIHVNEDVYMHGSFHHKREAMLASLASKAAKEPVPYDLPAQHAYTTNSTIIPTSLETSHATLSSRSSSSSTRVPYSGTPLPVPLPSPPSSAEVTPQDVNKISERPILPLPKRGSSQRSQTAPPREVRRSRRTGSQTEQHMLLKKEELEKLLKERRTLVIYTILDRSKYGGRLFDKEQLEQIPDGELLRMLGTASQNAREIATAYWKAVANILSLDDWMKAWKKMKVDEKIHGKEYCINVTKRKWEDIMASYYQEEDGEGEEVGEKAVKRVKEKAKAKDEKKTPARRTRASKVEKKAGMTTPSPAASSPATSSPAPPQTPARRGPSRAKRAKKSVPSNPSIPDSSSPMPPTSSDTAQSSPSAYPTSSVPTSTDTSPSLRRSTRLRTKS